MKSHVTWALAGASVVLLGFTSMQFTDAAWSSSESSDAGTIQTGHLRITGAGQSALNVSGLGKKNMNNGDQVQIPLTVYNDSTIPVDYRLVSVTPLAGTNPPALQLRVARVASEAQCPTEGPTLGNQGVQLYKDDIPAANVTNVGRNLDVGADDVLCLTATAVSVGSGKSGQYVFTFQADQL